MGGAGLGLCKPAFDNQTPGHHEASTPSNTTSLTVSDHDVIAKCPSGVDTDDNGLDIVVY